MDMVWQLSIISFNRNLHYLEGIVVSGKAVARHTPTHRLKHISQTVGSYLKKPLVNKPIEIRIEQSNYQCKSDRRGNFTLWVKDLITEKSEIKIFLYEQELPIIQSSPVFFPASPGQFDVISDIDDTILVSHTLSHFKRVLTTVGKQVHKRELIPYTQQLLKYTETYNPSYFYVSRSEKNLFHLLSDTLRHHRLPKGPLLLTPFLRWHQLLKPGKPIEHKYETISKLIEHSTDKDFILIGDDTQQDMQVYLKVIRRYKARVRMVFIRQTKTFKTEYQVKNWEAIINEGIPGIYYQAFEPFNPTLLKPIL